MTAYQTNFPPQNTVIIDEKGQITTPWMAFLRALFFRTGEGPGIVPSVNLTATGSLTDDWNYVVAAGAITLQALTGGQMQMVYNASGVNINISGPTGSTIDGSVGAYSLANTKMQLFWFLSSSQIISTQLG